MGVEKFYDVILSDFFNVGYFFAYRRETIRVAGIDQVTQVMSHIAIGLVEAHFFELFNDDTALHFESLVAEGEAEHAVAFEPKCRFGILCRQAVIEVSEIVSCPRIVPPSGLLHCLVKVGNVYAATKHQMLK